MKREALDTLVLAETKIASGQYQLIILDEINIAVYRKFLSLEQVLGLLEKKPPALELVLTGRYAPSELIKRADLVTEMLAIKHPVDAGQYARIGIEL